MDVTDVVRHVEESPVTFVGCHDIRSDICADVTVIVPRVVAQDIRLMPRCGCYGSDGEMCGMLANCYVIGFGTHDTAKMAP